LGFGIVAQARRLEYKERSQRRLMAANSRPSSLRHMFSTSEQSATETSPLVSGKIEMTTQQDGVESVKVKGETTVEALMDIIFGQWVSILLIFSPFALASHFLEWDAKYTFWFWCVS
jgi:hypothetical protein